MLTTNITFEMKNRKFLAWIFHGKVRKRHTPPPISGVDVEEVNNYRFLGITITKNLSRLSCITTLVKKKQKKPKTNNNTELSVLLQ